MNDDAPAADDSATPTPDAAAAASAPAASAPAADAEPFRMIVRMWPKSPVLYPVALCALLCAILSHFYGISRHVDALAREIPVPVAVAGADAAADSDAAAADEATANDPLVVTAVDPGKLRSARNFDRVLASVFLVFLGLAMFSVCIDFEIRWAIIAFAILVIIILGLVITNIYWQTFPGMLRMLTGVTALASPQFYLAIFIVWAVLMLVSLVIVRFHYVKIESNELVVVGGFLERQQRFSTFRMAYTKEIQDVLEYYLPLVRSGRLVFTFPGETQVVVIDNVLQIDRVIEELDKLTSALRVEDAHHLAAG